MPSFWMVKDVIKNHVRQKTEIVIFVQTNRKKTRFRL